MNATYVKNICRQLLQKSTPTQSELIFGGSRCKRQCPGVLPCGRVADIYSPVVCGLPTYGDEFWVILVAIAALIMLAGVGGWALGTWTLWANVRLAFLDERVFFNDDFRKRVFLDGVGHCVLCSSD